MIAKKPETMNASLASQIAVAGREEIDPGDQQDDHPGVDQIAIDLLHAGDDRRRGARVLRRDREEERVAEGRAECQHDREDVQEQRDLVAGVAESSRASSAETYPSGDGAKGRPSRLRKRRSASVRPSGANDGGDLVELGREQARTDQGRRAGDGLRSNSGEAPADHPPAPSRSAARRPPSGSGAVMLATVVGASSGRHSRRLRRSSPIATPLTAALVADASIAAARGRSRRPGPSRAWLRRSRAPRSRSPGRSAGRSPRRRRRARAAVRGRGGWSGGRRCRRPGRGRRPGRSRPRGAPPRRAAARAAPRPAAVCGSPPAVGPVVGDLGRD